MQVLVTVMKVRQEWDPNTNTNSNTLLLRLGGAEVEVPVTEAQLAEVIKTCVTEGIPDEPPEQLRKADPVLYDDGVTEIRTWDHGSQAPLSEEDEELLAEYEELKRLAAQLGMSVEELLEQNNVGFEEAVVFSSGPMPSPSPFISEETPEPRPNKDPGILAMAEKTAAEHRPVRTPPPKAPHVLRKAQIREQLDARGGPAAQNARDTLDAIRAKAKAHPGRRVAMDDMGYPTGVGVREAQQAPQPQSNETDEDGFAQG